MSDRLDQRNDEMWDDYTLRSMSQRQLSEKYNLSQAQVSRVLAEVREGLPPRVRDELITRRVEQLDMLVRAVLPEAMTGDKDAIASYNALVTRESKLLGLDAAIKQDVTADVKVNYVIEGLDD